MSAIAYQAKAHESRASMVKSYTAAHAALWGPPPVREKPVPPIVEVKKPVRPAKPASVPILSDDEYAEMLVENFAASRRAPRPGPTQIINFIAAQYGKTPAELTSHIRNQSIVRPRHIAMYIMVCGMGFSYPRTAKAMGGRDHTTAFVAVRKMKEKMASDPFFAARVANLMAALGINRE